MNNSKKYREIKEKIINKNYYLKDALNILSLNNKNFSENIELSFSIEFISKKPLKIILKLPEKVENKKKIAIFIEDLPEEILKTLKNEEKYIEFLNIEQLKNKISKNKRKWNFYKFLVFEKSEEKLKEVKEILTKIGIYPKNKDRTLLKEKEDIIEEIEKFKRGEREVKFDKSGNISFLIGRDGFDYEKIENNFKFAFSEITNLLPKNSKIRKIVISKTMSPGIELFF